MNQKQQQQKIIKTKKETNPTTTPSAAGTAKAEPPKKVPNKDVGQAEKETLKLGRTPDARVPKGAPAKVTEPETVKPSNAPQTEPMAAESGTTKVEPLKQAIDPGWEIRCKPRAERKPAQPQPQTNDPLKKKVGQRQRKKFQKRRELESSTSADTQEVEAPKKPDVEATTSKEPTQVEPVAKTKRPRLDDTTSPRGDHKKIKADAQGARKPHPTYAAAAATDLTVAITNERTGRLSQQDAMEVENKIGDAIFQEAIEIDLDTVAEAPAFTGKPSLVDGYLKLWCQNARTKTWLMSWITTATLENGDHLVGKREDEMVRKTMCGILIPSLEDNFTKVGRVLNYQNPWAQVKRWTINRAIPLRTRGCTLLLVGIPEDIIPTVMEKDRKLNYLCGTIYIRFQHGGGHFRDSPPEKNANLEEYSTQNETNKAAEGEDNVSTPTDMETDAAEVNDPCSDVEEGILLDSDDEDGCTKGISRLELKAKKVEGTSSDGSFPL